MKVQCLFVAVALKHLEVGHSLYITFSLGKKAFVSPKMDLYMKHIFLNIAYVIFTFIEVDVHLPICFLYKALQIIPLAVGFFLVRPGMIHSAKIVTICILLALCHFFNVFILNPI